MKGKRGERTTHRKSNCGAFAFQQILTLHHHHQAAHGMWCLFLRGEEAAPSRQQNRFLRDEESSIFSEVVLKEGNTTWLDIIL
jgi:hypothetical protein